MRFRTPLNGILGMASLLRQTDLTAEQMDNVETISKCGDALLSVINDILDISKLEAGSLDIEQAAFELPALAAAALRVASGTAEAKGLAVDCEISPDLPTVVRGDQQRIRQVLLNLLSNAIKFTVQGSVSLKICSGQGEAASVRFEVTDTGIGVADSATDRLFKEFSQVDASISRRFGGTGLGLAISKRLVQAMGGTIGLISKEREGSTFWFELPLEPATIMLPEPAVGAVPSSGPAALQILVVEDIVVNQKVAMRMLLSLGHRVDVAATGDQAVELVKSNTYDLIFMDMQMPGMNGLEAAAAIRLLGGWREQVPIVALTANAFESDRKLCLAAGMNDFVAKPIALPDLGAAIQRVLGRKPALGETAEHELRPEALDQRQLRGLIDHLGVDDMVEVVEAFAEGSNQLLEQLQLAVGRGQWQEQLRILESLQDDSSLLGFSASAYECQTLKAAVPEEAAAVHRLRQSLATDTAVARAVLWRELGLQGKAGTNIG